MNNIKLLDDITIQQIAAGEIIDRPAAIVKEIIENSMDAGANTITLEIRKGGKSYIRVTDNGHGIAPNDIDLAFERHSTSKLHRAEDLYDIHSFGFRGEALASIAAVARVELLTKTRDTKGSQSFIEDGRVLKTETVGCPNGTTIIMKDIFHNFPVRRDFLKSDSVEGNRITDTVTRLALGNPDISFKYIKDDRVVFKSPGKGDLMQTIYSILGRDFNNNLVPLDYEKEQISIKGFISKNSFYRSNRSHQYLYVNKRFIKNMEITNNLESEYRSLIPINRYPIFFLFIDLDPGKIDVNIHPTKQEINFVDQDSLMKAIKEAVGTSLRKSLDIQAVPDRVKRKNKDKIPHLYESTFFDSEDNIKSHNERGSKEDLAQVKSKSIYPSENAFSPNSNKIETSSKKYNITSLVDDQIDNEDIYNLDRIKELAEDKYLESHIPSKDNSVQARASEEKIKSKREEFKDLMANLTIVGIVFQTYILAEDKVNKDLIMIDQHAAHERIMYEEYLKKYREAKISTQILMTPQVLELSDLELDSFKKNKEFFDQVGFSIDLFGGGSIIIRGTPMIFGKPEPNSIFYEVLDRLNQDMDSPYEIKLDKIMKLACTSAIKSGDSIVDLEIQALIDRLVLTETPYTCPHGRPTIVKVSQKQIEKDFKRIM